MLGNVVRCWNITLHEITGFGELEEQVRAPGLPLWARLGWPAKYTVPEISQPLLLASLALGSPASKSELVHTPASYNGRLRHYMGGLEVCAKSFTQMMSLNFHEEPRLQVTQRNQVTCSRFLNYEWQDKNQT